MNNHIAIHISAASRRGFWPAVTALTAIVAVASAIFGLQIGDAESDTPAAMAPVTSGAVATVSQNS